VCRIGFSLLITILVLIFHSAIRYCFAQSVRSDAPNQTNKQGDDFAPGFLSALDFLSRATPFGNQHVQARGTLQCGTPGIFQVATAVGCGVFAVALGDVERN